MKYWKVINEANELLYWGSGTSVTGVEITPEEYATLEAEHKAHQVKVAEYVQKVQNGIITMADVPAEYHDEVYDIVNVPEPTYTLDEAAAIIASEVAGNE